MKERSVQRGAIWGAGGGTGANCEDFVGARSVERELGFDDVGVRVRLRALAEGGSRVVHPHPAPNGEIWENRAQYV